RKAPRPSTKRSGSIRNTSPTSESASAATNQSRRASWRGSSTRAARSSATITAGLHTYSTRLTPSSTATQSATAKPAATAISAQAPPFTSPAGRAAGAAGLYALWLAALLAEVRRPRSIAQPLDLVARGQLEKRLEAADGVVDAGAHVAP